MHPVMNSIPHYLPPLPAHSAKIQNSSRQWRFHFAVGPKRGISSTGKLAVKRDTLAKSDYTALLRRSRPNFREFFGESIGYRLSNRHHQHDSS
jgi:hypothetical protein